MKKLFILCFLTLSLNAFSSDEKCTNSLFEGSYTLYITSFLDDLKYEENVSAEKLDSTYDMSLANLLLQKDDNGIIKFKFQGLTSTGIEVLDMLGKLDGQPNLVQETKDSLIAREELSLTAKLDNGTCTLVDISSNETFLLFNKSYSRLFSLEQEEGEPVTIAELYKKHEEVVEGDDPFSL